MVNLEHLVGQAAVVLGVVMARLVLHTLAQKVETQLRQVAVAVAVIIQTVELLAAQVLLGEVV
jgi:hypothetical protein